MRLVLIAAAFALVAQPLLAQDEVDQLLGTGPQAQQAADGQPALDTAPETTPTDAPVIPDANTPGDPAQFAEIARLNAAALAAAAEVAARDRARTEAYRADLERSAAAQAAYEAAQARYQAELRAHQEAVARAAAERAAWEAECRSGKYSRCLEH